MLLFVFFFQAEDGIRDGHVTGVQTCALPISRLGATTFCGSSKDPSAVSVSFKPLPVTVQVIVAPSGTPSASATCRRRSEERREGKRVDDGGRRVIGERQDVR